MITTRQRFLLVAGWLVAAIGSGLVASAAVSVAGGQVLDRPLRPLTAAEVAALPVVTVGSAAVFEPHASGGVVSTTGEPTEGSGDADASAEPLASAGRSVAPLAETTPKWDRFTNPGNSETRVVSILAGKASFAIADETLHLLWVTPGAGYVAQTLLKEDTAISILFTSNRDVWLIEAAIIDGSLTVAIGPTPLA